MAFRIKIVRYAATGINYEYFGAYRMRAEVVAVEGDGMDPNIFVYRRTMPTPYEGSSVCDEFQAVAGPAQMADLPSGEPDPERGWPFYRLSAVELDFIAQSRAEEVWNQLLHEAAVLCEAMSTFQNLSMVQETWVPDAPETGDSQSQSVSQSSAA